MFSPVDPKQSFPKMEEALLKIWKENRIFEKSVKNPAGLGTGGAHAQEGNPTDYVFYDGPPFATGLPHYGHLLAGTIKDVIPRYFTMRGYRIERKWGWDCHGLPVENIVEKELNLGSKTDIEAYGIAQFNEACRSVVLRYTEEWKSTVERMGRWVDMENDYKTMDPDFMESIWWVFQQIWNKGLIYEGNKVVPYCPRCATPLSNFETNQGYKDKQDPALTVKFELADEPKTYILAWTTTPWTLPSNLALAVGPEITYAKIRDKSHANGGQGGEHYILALDRVPHYYKNPEDYEVMETFLGATLEGKKYTPPLPYFAHKQEPKVFTIATGNFVTVGEGTGVVHMAPFGEDDMAVIKKLEIEPVHPLDAECRFNELVEEFKGKTAFEANPDLIKKLKDTGKLVRHETINHSYPFCWRCDTALIYRPISTWFVKVEALKKELLENNQQINWIPEHIKDGRFGKWLEGARDWAISRNRYWGTPLPVWRSASGEVKCVGSREELEKLCGEKIADLHKHKIDHITFPCKNPQKADITFVRHGQTDANLNHIWAGSLDVPLNETGLKQAEEVAKTLKTRMDSGEIFDLIVCSTLTRAKQTATIINKQLGLPITFESGLREHHYGDWEGKSNDDLMREYGLEDVAQMRMTTAPKGETFDQVTNRVRRVYEKYLGKKILVVSHGHVYLTSLCLAHGKTLDEVVNEPHENAVPYNLVFEDRLRRIPEVLDCWFESGSMPYAQLHYPFENKTLFEANFPARFIAEGLDQTRGWFYTLHVLSTALSKDAPKGNAFHGKGGAFQNCVVNGIILAEDGQKMSKRLKNYPDPSEVVEKYGADALRFYLMNSPVVKADDMRFSERGVEEVVKGIILPLWNAYSFFVTYANVDGWQADKASGGTGEQGTGARSENGNKLDRWILARLDELVETENLHMGAYDLQKASNAIYSFVDDLTNWYIRRSRRRFWKSEDDGDKADAYATLYEVLTTLCRIIAPFMPFVSDEIYRNLTDKESVHLESYPGLERKDVTVYAKPLSIHFDRPFKLILAEIATVKTVVSLGLAARAKAKIKVRQPLQKVQVALGDLSPELLKDQLDTIKEELNVKEVELIKNADELATLIAKPNAKALGPKYGKEVQNIITEAKAGRFEKLPNGNLKVLSYEITPDEIEIAYLSKEGADIETERGILVSLDTTITPELEREGVARDLIRQIQELRKAADYKVDDRIKVALIGVDSAILNTPHLADMISDETLAHLEKDIATPDRVIEFEGVTIKVKR